jgi:antitoxin (DNA-binding transcriptional repressor) of toxin-antitoxin stability system
MNAGRSQFGSSRLGLRTTLILRLPHSSGYDGHVEKATISQLKNRLSAYLKKVRAGATVLIFDRDQPIARLERIETSGRVDDRIRRLEKAGVVRRPRRALRLESLKPMLEPPSRSVVEALLEDRREGR